MGIYKKKFYTHKALRGIIHVSQLKSVLVLLCKQYKFSLVFYIYFY